MSNPVDQPNGSLDNSHNQVAPLTGLSSALPEQTFQNYHQHNDSTSTSTSDSNDSSPTTTASTVDDSSATEPSPGSSPESPMAKPPASKFGTSILRPRTSEDGKAAGAMGPFFDLQRPATPGRKGRNLKNLAVNTNASRTPGRAASTNSLPLSITPETTAEPDPPSDLASPSFVKPPTPPKRRPSNLGLTIMTPGSSNQPPQQIRLSIPPTPSLSRPGTLRHFQSSPSLPLFASRLGSQAGLPSFQSRVAPLETILSPTQVKEAEVEEEEEQNFDVPQSKEEKPEAYPNGPITVYEPHIDLYLEPTAEQAAEYDVIMNVASEVRNPFLTRSAPASAVDPDPEIRIDGGGGIQYAPRREQVGVRQQAEILSRQDSSPTTPKATPQFSAFPSDVKPKLPVREPEYIHIPWEHNTDIVPDLLRLVKLIEDRVSEGKRVLVHCQCGVSRSASLVVAYGLYKDPSMSVQEAYDIVKKRSRWIGPNMSLIMQLQEFRSSLARGGLIVPDSRSPITPSSAFNEWRCPMDAAAESTPRTAPLSPLMVSPAPIPTSAPLSPVRPGPSSAPSGAPWPIAGKETSVIVQPPPVVKTEAAYVDPSGHIVPIVMLVQAEPAAPLQTREKKNRPLTLNLAKDNNQRDATAGPLVSPRSAEFAMAPLQPPKEVDAADAFGLMSPSTTEFSTSPFDRAALLSSLGMGSAFRQHEPETPRRSLSTRQRSPQLSSLAAARPLRPKYSSPSIHEQRRLQSVQAELEASFPSQTQPASAAAEMDGLMSPRATEFTQNPFALSLSVPSESLEPSTPTSRDQDPRSPAQKGASPITRNILDYL